MILKKTVAYLREDECDPKMAANNVHVQLCMMIPTMFEEGQETFQNRTLVQSKTTIGAQSLLLLIGLSDSWSVFVVADWYLRFLISSLVPCDLEKRN